MILNHHDVDNDDVLFVVVVGFQLSSEILEFSLSIAGLIHVKFVLNLNVIVVVVAWQQ